jgi:ABC-type Mn2+/Zn2+ transport system permease subunit
MADQFGMPPPKVAKTLARVIGVILILLAIVAFLPNPVIGAEGYFRTNAALNAVIAALGFLLLLSTTKGEETAASGLYMVAMLALSFALVGHIQMSENPSGGEAKLFDLLVCNYEDVWLMAGMAVVMIISGMMNTSSRQVIRD